MQPWMRDAVLKLTGQYGEQPLQHMGMLTKVSRHGTVLATHCQRYLSCIVVHTAGTANSVLRCQRGAIGYTRYVGLV